MFDEFKSYHVINSRKIVQVYKLTFKKHTFFSFGLFFFGLFSVKIQFLFLKLSSLVLVSLTQLVWTMHKNMQGSGFEPRPPQKKKTQ